MTLPNIGRPARNALLTVNITELKQLTPFTAQDILKLHGVGPKAVEMLTKALEAEGLYFAEKAELPFSTPFMVVGDLGCDNAPKRRVVRDYLIASWMQDQAQLTKCLSEEVTIETTNSESHHGLEALISLRSVSPEQISSLEIKQILSHGKYASAHGKVTKHDGSTIHFAEFQTFESHKKDARISHITIY